jgi:hypothetical protein
LKIVQNPWLRCSCCCCCGKHKKGENKLFVTLFFLYCSLSIKVLFFIFFLLKMKLFNFHNIKTSISFFFRLIFIVLERNIKEMEMKRKKFIIMMIFGESMTMFLHLFLPVKKLGDFWRSEHNKTL